MAKKTDEYTPAAPFPMSPVSNGEFCPRPPTSTQRLAAKLIAEETEIHARRTGMSRRRFLRTAAGTATAFAVLNKIHGLEAWGDNAVLPVQRVHCEDLAAGHELLDHKMFVMDVQTHHLDTEHPNAEPICELLNFCDTFGSLIGATCSELSCPDKLGQVNFIKELFIDSQTSMGVISGVPNGTILGPQLMADTRDLTNQLAGSQRTVIQAMIDPLRPLGESTSLDTFEHQVNDLGAKALKCYTYNGDWRLDDETVAYPMLAEASRLGLKLVNVHKGLAQLFGADPEYVRPTDLAKAARGWPKLKFCAYHSGYFFPGEHPEGKEGISELVEVVESMDRKDAKRIYAEIGSTFAIALLSGPDQAAHLMGQLLKTFGPKRIVWGTDSMWWGSPQFLIDAFYNLEIPDSMREEFGYPKLTKGRKRRILGLNAARLYGIKRGDRKDLCTIPEDSLTAIQTAQGGFRANRSLRAYGPRTQQDYLALLRRDERPSQA
ncbi:MAG: amidohydrolase [Myxococcales bacterium]|nr:MAG: amidohydrolase [Myxococcales bacterium]